MWLERLVAAAEERVVNGYYDRRPADALASMGSLRAAVERAYPAVVAEIKPGRPGVAPRRVHVETLARAFADGGACALSVLTEPDHFGGSLANLERARVGWLPLLMKDFIVDERQLEAARAWGASAVLAILRLETAGFASLPYDQLCKRARALGLEVLAEVTTSEELELALETPPDLLGVNARDLDTLAMDATRTARLLEGRRLAVPVLHLSGVEGPADVAAALKAGAQGVLVGGALLDAPDPRRAVLALRGVSP